MILYTLAQSQKLEERETERERMLLRSRSLSEN